MSRRSCIVVVAAVVKGKQEQKKMKALNGALYFLFLFGTGFLGEEKRALCACSLSCFSGFRVAELRRF